MNRAPLLFLMVFTVFCMLPIQIAATGIGQSDLELQTEIVKAVEQALTSLRSTKSWGALLRDLRLLDADIEANKITINLSKEVLNTGLGSQGFEQVVHDIHFSIGEAIHDQLRGVEYFTLIEGVPLHQLFPKNERSIVPRVSAQVASDMSVVSQSISGKRIVISPGHGWVWKESYNEWRLQRDDFWGIVEDLVTAEMTMYLNSDLVVIGAYVYPTRNMSKAAGTGESGHPKWEEAARYHIKSLGAPESVWNEPGVNHKDQDIRSRPRYANWVNADILVNIHTNDAQGTGTETWFDTTNGYQDESERLANILQDRIIAEIRSGL